MLSWGGEASTVHFAELCIFKSIIMTSGISLVLAEEGRVLYLQVGCFSRCSTQAGFMSDKSGQCYRAIEVFRGGSVIHCFILFIKSNTL